MILKNKKNIAKAALLTTALAAVCIIVLLSAKSSSQPGQRTFFSQFVISGGPIVWLALLPLSVATVGLIIDYCLKIKPSALLQKDCGAEIIRTIRKHGWQRLTETLSDKSDFVSLAVFGAVRNKSIDRREAQTQLQMQSCVSETLKQQCRVLMRKIEPLNIIGNVAPMIGLFGTVFGMIKLFNSIVVSSGQPSPEQMADGISVALVTTFWGLLVAIPALVAHSIFSNKIEAIGHQGAIQTEMILVEIKDSIEVQQKKNEA